MNSGGDISLLPQPPGISSNPSFSPSQINTKAMIINQSPTQDSQNALPDPSNVKWTRVNDVSTSSSIQPRPRHGHRAVAYGNYMIVFGGGNEGIVEELHVFDTSTHEWFQPPTKGDIPPGCAAYGLVLDGCRMLMYGGMIEYGRYSSDLYELNIPKWEWKKLKPKPPRNGSPPCARLGHSFTIIRDQVFLFGGLANDSDDLKNNIPRYLNDMYTLQVRLNNEHGAWDIPSTFGTPPGPRESHTAVAYVSRDKRFNKLIVYGGMSGCRLGDLYILDTDTLMWCKPEVGGATPSPRSLHTATLVGEKMYVFGGWVPMLVEELKNSEKEWKCTNSLACLNVENLTWENLHQDILDEKVPRARAGHSAVVINTRIYVWSGRDGYRKAWNNQVCCKDLWQLEVDKPGDPGKVQLLRAGTNWLEVGWNPVPGADSYILQCVAYEFPSEPGQQPDASSSAHPPTQSLAASGYASTTPIMTPALASKPSKSAVPPVKDATPSPAPVAAASIGSLGSPAQMISGIAAAPIASPQQAGNATPNSAPIQVVQTSLPSVVSQQQPSQASTSVPMQVSVSVQQSLPDSTTPQVSSAHALSMPSLSAVPASTIAAAAETSAPAPIVSAISSVSPAVLPSASSLYTLPANVAGTASSLIVSKTVTRPVTTPISNAQSAGRGVLRLRTPVQVGQPRAPTVVTNLPPGAVIKASPGTMLSSNVSEASAQLSGMHALAAAAASTQKIQTPQQTVKVVQQSPGQQVFSQVKVANMSGVLPAGVRLGSPVSSPNKAAPGTGNVKQIIVQKPGGAGAGNQIYTVVQTSKGMALANIQGSKVIQSKTGVPATNVVPASSIQPTPQKTANIIKWVAAPGGGVPTASKPNIIANQSILGLAGQGTSSSGSTPTYIISKPASTVASRPQGPQYVVVTQASTIRSLQGITSNSIAGSQTITLPTSASSVVNQQGVKMIVMPSASGAGTAGQSVKIITPTGMQASTAPKTVTLAASKPTQYITSGGQIVTLPPGLLQAGSQSINIGGKQVTLQMAGGQKLAILANNSGQIIQTSQAGGDAGKPKFVMVGTSQKTLPTSAPMRISMGGVIQPDSTTSATIGQDVGAAAEGLVEMASGSAEPMDQGLNGIDGDQGGLKGGGMYGPWSSFSFAGLPWMKLKGGGVDNFDERALFNCSRDSTIPIYSASTKFSWRNAFSGLGLKGGGNGNAGEGSGDTSTQETQNIEEEATQRIEDTSEAMDTSDGTSAAEAESTQLIHTQELEDVNATTTTATDAISNENTQVLQDEAASAESEAPTQQTNAEEMNEVLAATQPVVENPEASSSNAEIQSSMPELTPTQEAAPVESSQSMQVPTTMFESSTAPVTEALGNVPITFELQPPTAEGISNADASGGQQPIAVIPITTSASGSSDETIVMSFAIPTQSLQDPSAPQIIQQQSSADQLNETSSIQTAAQDQPLPQITFTTQAGTQQITLQQQPQQQQQLAISQPTPVTSQPTVQHSVSQPVTQVVFQQQQQQPTSLPQQSIQIPLQSSAGASPISVKPSFVISTGNPNAVPQSVASLVSAVSLAGSQPSIIYQGSTLTAQTPTSSVATSNPILLQSGVPVSISGSPGTLISMASAIPSHSAASPAPIRISTPSAPVIRTQTPETARVANSSSVAPTSSVSTNGTYPAGQSVTTLQVKNQPVTEEKSENWMDVIHTRNTNFVVKCYFTTNEKLSKLEPDSPVDKDLEFIKKKIELKPATAYKFRVAAINSCGRGPWGEVTAFKTCLPGFPGAPSSIKISKSADGATIAWEPPLNTPGDILEYSVYLAVKPPPNAPEPKPGVTNLSFVRVYCGPSNQCNVPTISLNQALVDTTSKPAIIFRIAAKNDKGYGPATQVRWLQESAAPSFVGGKSGILKRTVPFAAATANKRSRDGN